MEDLNDLTAALCGYSERPERPFFRASCAQNTLIFRPGHPITNITIQAVTASLTIAPHSEPKGTGGVTFFCPWDHSCQLPAPFAPSQPSRGPWSLSTGRTSSTPRRQLSQEGYIYRGACFGFRKSSWGGRTGVSRVGDAQLDEQERGAFFPPASHS